MSNTECKQAVASCVCAEPEGHVEAGQPVHKCKDTDVCKGEWTGETEENIVPVVFPGGYTTYEEAREAALRVMLGLS